MITDILRSRSALAVGSLVLLLVGLITSLTVVRQRQTQTGKASVPSGVASLNFTPSSGTYDLGQSFPLSVSFTTGGEAISGVAIRLRASFSSSPLPIAVTNLRLSPDITGSGDWTCPVRVIDPQPSAVTIDVACLYLNGQRPEEGFTATGPTLFATVDVVATDVPSPNPMIFLFDADQSILGRKSDGQDVLMTPSASVSFLINPPASSLSPTPSLSPLPTATPVPPLPTSTPQPIVPSATPTLPPIGGLQPSPTATRRPPTATTSPRPTIRATSTPTVTDDPVYVRVSSTTPSPSPTRRASLTPSPTVIQPFPENPPTFWQQLPMMLWQFFVPIFIVFLLGVVVVSWIFFRR